MGLFTSVWKNDRCNRCGAMFRCEYQFKTDNDCCASFENRERNAGARTVPKGTYEGGHDILCRDCRNFFSTWERWLADQTVTAILNLGDDYMVGRSGTSFSTSIFYKKTRVADIVNTRIWANAKFAKTSEFQRLSKAVIDLWKRSIRSAELDRFYTTARKRYASSFGDQDCVALELDRRDTYERVGILVGSVVKIGKSLE